MRSSTLKTFDGKTIVVPNEQFITTAFTNWTHQDTLQRYDFEFSVAYDSDIPKVPEIIIAAIRKHPQVLEEPEKPDWKFVNLLIPVSFLVLNTRLMELMMVLTELKLIC